MSNWSVNIPFGQDKVTSTVRHDRKLGTHGFTPDHREFRWAFSGGTIGAGAVVSTPVAQAVHDRDLNPSAAGSVGDMTVSIVVGAVQIEKDFYEDGYLIFNNDQGEGHMYLIKSHALILSTGTGVFTLWEPIREAYLTTSEVGLHPNEMKDVVASPAANINPSVGVAPTEVADNTYFWAQIKGMCNVLFEDGVTAGQTVGPSETNDVGAVSATDYAGTAEWQIIGVAFAAVGANLEYGLVLLNI